MFVFMNERWVERMEAMYQLAKNGEYPRATSLPPFMELNRESRIFDFAGGSGWTIEKSSGLLPNVGVPLTVGFRMLSPNIKEGLRE